MEYCVLPERSTRTRLVAITKLNERYRILGQPQGLRIFCLSPPGWGCCCCDQGLCRCAPNARTQQGRKGEAADVSNWDVLKVEVEVCLKCESGFTYISGVFNDSGDLKTVCEAESTSMAPFTSISRIPRDDNTLLFSTNSLPDWKPVVMFILSYIRRLMLARDHSLLVS